MFMRGVPRLFVAALALAVFCLLPPEELSRGPDLCLWRHLFHIAACPACGSLRALAAFFHGRLGDAINFNRNVLITGPALVVLAVKDLLRAVSTLARSRFRTLGILE